MKKTFIHTVKTQNLRNLEEDLRAKSENVNSFYVVDTFDVVETCFPSLYTKNTENNKDLEIAIYLANQHLFFESVSKPIILDEYKVELFSFWANVHRKLEENYKIGKEERISNLISKYNSLKSPTEISQFIEEEIGLLLSLSINTIAISPLERFNQLLDGRLQINKFDCENDKDSLFLNTIFRSSKYKKDRVINIYKDFVDYNKYRLSSKSKNDIYVYLENSLRDIQVFDRILCINERLEIEFENGGLKEQYRLLYLSSAPEKSSLIQQLYRKLNIAECNNSCNIHRSNIDIHLFDLISSSFEKERKTDFAQLTEEMLALVEPRGHKLFEFDNTTKRITNQNKDNILDYSKLESLFYINKTKKGHLEDLNKTLFELKNEKKPNKSSTKELSKIFEKCLELLDKESLENNYIRIKAIIESHNEIFRVDNDIHQILNKSFQLNYRIHPSKDSVKSIIQSYPILLFYAIEAKKTLHKSIEDIFSKFINVSSSNSMPISYKPDSIGIYTGLYLELYSLFLSLLLDSPTRLSEEALLIQLNNLEIKAKNSIFKENKKSTDGIVKYYELEVNSDSELLKEIGYFKVWINRRLGNYKKGIKEATKYYIEYSDPRFLHGRALCLKSKFYSKKKTKPLPKIKQYLNRSIDDFISAEELYAKMDIHNNFLFEHIKIAVSNSICDTYIQLSILNDYTDDSIVNLKKIRLRIEALSKKLKKLGGNIEEHPAYCHTACEVYLESARSEIMDSNFDIAFKHYDEATRFYILIQYKEQLKGYSELLETNRRFNKIGRKLYLKTKMD